MQSLPYFAMVHTERCYVRGSFNAGVQRLCGMCGVAGQFNDVMTEVRVGDNTIFDIRIRETRPQTAPSPPALVSAHIPLSHYSM
jgi:hypothetical protein